MRLASKKSCDRGEWEHLRLAMGVKARQIHMTGMARDFNRWLAI